MLNLTKQSQETVPRLIKMEMNISEINTDIFGPHSVRSGSVSKTKLAALPVDEILRKAGWSHEGTMPQV